MFIPPLPPISQIIVDHLVSTIQPDIMFYYNESFHIVVSEQQGKTISVFKSLLHAATTGHEWASPSCNLYLYTEMTEGLEIGTPIFSSIFNEQNLIYTNHKKVLPQPLHVRIHKAKEQAQNLFSIGLQRSLTFYKGASQYIQTKDYDIAAFMLHQSIELLLRFLLLSIANKELKSHNLKENFFQFKGIAPKVFALCLNIGNPEVRPLIHHLDKAYSSARYANHFDISKDTIIEATVLVSALQNEAKKLFEVLVCTESKIAENRGVLLRQNSYSVTSLESQ